MASKGPAPPAPTKGFDASKYVKKNLNAETVGKLK